MELGVTTSNNIPGTNRPSSTPTTTRFSLRRTRHKMLSDQPILDRRPMSAPCLHTRAPRRRISQAGLRRSLTTAVMSIRHHSPEEPRFSNTGRGPLEMTQVPQNPGMVILSPSTLERLDWANSHTTWRQTPGAQTPKGAGSLTHTPRASLLLLTSLVASLVKLLQAAKGRRKHPLP